MARQSNKWKRKTLRKTPQKIIPSSTSNLSPSPLVDATSDPEELNIEKPETALLLWLETNRDQTQVQELSDSHEEKSLEGYVESWAAFADKYTQYVLNLTKSNFVSLVILGWFIFVIWLFIQDNGGGKLDDLIALQWFGMKILIFSGFLIIVTIVITKLWHTTDPELLTNNRRNHQISVQKAKR